MRETRKKAARVGDDYEYGRNCPRLAGKGADHRRGCTEDRVGSQIDQFFCEGLYPIRISGAPAKFDPKIAAIGPPQLRERTPECREVRLHSRIALRITHQHADPPYLLRLLRPRDQWPYRRAAEQRHELAPFHLIVLHSVPFAGLSPDSITDWRASSQ